jgi:hypothetical protein
MTWKRASSPISIERGGPPLKAKGRRKRANVERVKPISTVEEGGAAILQLAESPALAGRSGLCFIGLRESRADPWAYDETARKKLRALGFDLVGLADSQSALV